MKGDFRVKMYSELGRNKLEYKDRWLQGEYVLEEEFDQIFSVLECFGRRFFVFSRKYGNGQVSENLGSYWCRNGSEVIKLCKIFQEASIEKEEKKMSFGGFIVQSLGIEREVSEIRKCQE